MSPASEEREDGITHGIVRFLAWLKKRGAHQRLIYCRKKWNREGIDIREICRGPARGMVRVQDDPSTGEKWVVLDDLVQADILMIEFGGGGPASRAVEGTVNKFSVMENFFTV